MVVHACSPSYWKAEAGEFLNLGGRGCSELRLCHCIPAWATEQDCLREKKKENENVRSNW